MAQYDIIVAGSGIVGATTALLLAQQTQLQIALIEANPISYDWQKKNYDYRVSAISAASKKIFQDLQIWQSILEKRISSYSEMHVWDAEGKGEIHFDCAEVNANTLGYIIEDSVMRTSLLAALNKQANVDLLFPYRLVGLDRVSDGIDITLQDDKAFRMTAKLLIAADGANSIVRDLAKFELTSWDYEHTAIVTTVQTEYSHQQTAWQRFLPTGPLAFLPLQDNNQCSIVWSTSPEHAKQLLALSDEDFCKILQDAFANKLGEIKKITTRYHFPLRMRHAKNYVQPHLALIGDAAHTVHPLAGQGVNMGLLDAACLANVIAEAYKKNRDFSSLATLRRYERSRKSDNVTMLAGVEMLKRLFASENKTLQKLRNFGLNATDRLSPLKNFFASYAMGNH